jgi:hypothetical protein
MGSVDVAGTAALWIVHKKIYVRLLTLRLREEKILILALRADGMPWLTKFWDKPNKEQNLIYFTICERTRVCCCGHRNTGAAGMAQD